MKILNGSSMKKDAIKILKFLYSKKEKAGHFVENSQTLAENFKWNIKRTNNAVSYLTIEGAIKCIEQKDPKMKDAKINYHISNITSKGIDMLKSNTEVGFNIGPIFLKRKI